MATILASKPAMDFI
jgi:hypothetical protein